MVCIDFKIKLSFCGEYTPREMGVNLKQGYNGDLTSSEAGSVGGQMVKKMCPVHTMSFRRADRTAVGHEVEVRYIAGIGICR